MTERNVTGSEINQLARAAPAGHAREAARGAQLAAHAVQRAAHAAARAEQEPLVRRRATRAAGGGRRATRQGRPRRPGRAAAACPRRAAERRDARAGGATAATAPPPRAPPTTTAARLPTGAARARAPPRQRDRPQNATARIQDRDRTRRQRDEPATVFATRRARRGRPDAPLRGVATSVRAARHVDASRSLRRVGRVGQDVVAARPPCRRDRCCPAAKRAVRGRIAVARRRRAARRPSRYATAKPSPVLHAGWLHAALAARASTSRSRSGRRPPAAGRPLPPRACPRGDQPASENAPSHCALPSGLIAYAPLREIASTDSPAGRPAKAGPAGSPRSREAVLDPVAHLGARRRERGRPDPRTGAPPRAPAGAPRRRGRARAGHAPRARPRPRASCARPASRLAGQRLLAEPAAQPLLGRGLTPPPPARRRAGRAPGAGAS